MGRMAWHCPGRLRHQPNWKLKMTMGPNPRHNKCQSRDNRQGRTMILHQHRILSSHGDPRTRTTLDWRMQCWAWQFPRPWGNETGAKNRNAERNKVDQHEDERKQDELIYRSRLVVQSITGDIRSAPDNDPPDRDFEDCSVSDNEDGTVRYYLDGNPCDKSRHSCSPRFDPDRLTNNNDEQIVK